MSSESNFNNGSRLSDARREDLPRRSSLDRLSSLVVVSFEDLRLSSSLLDRRSSLVLPVGSDRFSNRHRTRKFSEKFCV